MTDTALARPDVLVVGAGPAGIAAARESAAAGLQVSIVDENPRPGGQVWRQRFPDRDEMRQTTGRFELPRTVTFLGSTVCVGFRDANEAVLNHRGELTSVSPRAVVLANGAYERVIPVPGWTLPGVMTAGAAQTLIKGSSLFPYQRVTVAGTGPLLLVTATQLLKAGVRVTSVLEASRPSAEQLRKIPAVLGGGRLVSDGIGYLLTLAKARVRLLSRYGVERVIGVDRAEGVSFRPLGRDWSFADRPDAREIDCDAVVFSHGFSSSVDIAAQLGLRLVWDGQRQSWRPWRTDDFETSRPLVYAVGDCAGVGGAQIAGIEGALAGMSVSEQLGGHVRDVLRGRRLQRRLRRLETFRAVMDGFSEVQPGAATWATRDTVICRCQGTTVGEMEEAIAHGVSTLHGLKLWTRAGMGRCQGRICAPIIRDRIDASRGDRSADFCDPPRARFPVRPVTAGAIARWSQ